MTRNPRVARQFRPLERIKSLVTMTFAFLKCWRDPYRPSGVYSKQGYIVFTTTRDAVFFFCPRYSLAYTSLRYGEQRHLTPAVCSNTRQTWKNIYMTKTTDRQTRYQRNKSNGNANCPNERDFPRSNCPANSLEMVHLQIRLLCFVYDQDSTICLPKEK